MKKLFKGFIWNWKDRCGQIIIHYWWITEPCVIIGKHTHICLNPWPPHLVQETLSRESAKSLLDQLEPVCCGEHIFSFPHMCCLKKDSEMVLTWFHVSNRNLTCSAPTDCFSCEISEHWPSPLILSHATFQLLATLVLHDLSSRDQAMASSLMSGLGAGGWATGAPNTQGRHSQPLQQTQTHIMSWSP